MIQSHIRIEKKRMFFAFFIPILIWIISLAFAQIGLGFDKSLAFSDANSQYLIFHAELREILLNQDWGQFFYNWNLGLGGSFIGVFGYYLSSPFALLSIFFKPEQLTTYFYFAILLKVGLCGLTAYLCLSHQTNATPNKSLLFAWLYPFIGTLTDRFYNIMWLDAIYLLPLCIWMLQRLIYQKKWKGFFVSLILLFWSNFYMAYMVGIFCLIWFLIETLRQKTFDAKEWLPLIFKFLGSTLLAAGICAVLLIPVLFQMKEGNYSLTIAFDYQRTIFQSLSDFFIGTYNSIENNQVGNIYLSLFGLLMAFSFFFHPNIIKKEKMIFLSIVGFFLFSLTNPILEWVWHGFKMPQSFPNRYSFLLSFLLIYLGHQSFITPHTQKAIKGERGLTQTIPYFLGFHLFFIGYTFFFPKHLEFITEWPILVINFIFSLLYVALFYSLTYTDWNQEFKIKRVFSVLLLTLLGVELGLNQFMSFTQLKNTLYAFQTQDKEELLTLKEALTTIEIEETDRFQFPGFTANISLLHHVKTINNFNTMGHRTTNGFMEYLYTDEFQESGLKTGDNLFAKTTPHLFIDSLLGVKYYYKEKILSPEFLPDWLIEKNEDFLENPYALPLAFEMDSNALDIDWNVYLLEGTPVERQEKLLNALLGRNIEDEDYLTLSYPITILSVTPYGLTYNSQNHYYRSDDLKTGYLEFEVEPVEVKNLPIHLQIQTASQVLLQIGESEPILVRDDIYLSSDAISTWPTTIRLIVGEETTRDIQGIQINYLDEEVLKEGFTQLKTSTLEGWILENTQAKVQVSLDEEKTFWVSIPYSENWRATIDGKPIPIHSIADAFMAITLPSGDYELILTYTVKGLKEGVFISIASLVITAGLILNNKKKKAF